MAKLMRIFTNHTFQKRKIKERNIITNYTDDIESFPYFSTFKQKWLFLSKRHYDFLKKKLKDFKNFQTIFHK